MFWEYYDPDYVAEMTAKERYEEESDGSFEEPWAVYDPD